MDVSSLNGRIISYKVTTCAVVPLCKPATMPDGGFIFSGFNSSVFL
jgi:hypothetical protein